MTDISIYFTPVPDQIVEEQKISSFIQIYQESFPDLSEKGIAIFTVPEYRGADLSNHTIDLELIRNRFYNLNVGVNWKMALYDLGSILPGKELNDTYFAVSQVVEQLYKKGIIPIVIGGSQDLFVAVHNGYKNLEQVINTCTIDYKYDLGSPSEHFDYESFVGHLLVQRPCILFNHAVIGLQAPYTSILESELSDKLFFDSCRLGEFVQDMKTAEPLLRYSDCVNIDVRCIKRSETGSAENLPNGFSSQQICQLAWYAGMSDKLSSFGLFNLFSINELSSSLFAEIIWYFVEGVSNRKGDFPASTKRDYLKFTVLLEDGSREVVFYKSNKSERWWLEVPYPPNKNNFYERHALIPCNKEDYDAATKNTLPDLWWRTYHKLF